MVGYRMLFGVPDEITDVTRVSGMVRKRRLIYRMTSFDYRKVFGITGNVPGVILGILVDAFSFRSAVGGVAGYGISRCVSYGIARGVFSNEAGLGSLAVLNGSAEMASEELQGQWAIFEVFFDTIVSCTLTALVILCSGVPVGYGAAAGAELTISGFTSTYGNWVSIFTAVAMCCFAFSTIIGWGLYGARCAEFLFKEKAIRPFMVLYSLVAIIGATVDLGLLWSIAETFNGLMAIPNLIALFLLSGTVVKLTKDYFNKYANAPDAKAS